MLEAATWQLSVTGLVRETLSLGLDQLEADVASHVSVLRTLECVYGFWGTAIWTGVPVRVLLDRAGIDLGRTRRVRFRGVDDFYDNLRIEDIYATRAAGDPFEPVVAFRIAGQPLPAELGFPARLLTGDRLGFKNIKWLASIEATDSDEPFSRYLSAGFVDDEGIVPVQTRLGTGAGSVPAGALTLCGRALSGKGGIQSVELAIDEGEFLPAHLSSLAELRAANPSIDQTEQARDPDRYPRPLPCLWMPWRYTWDATSGKHTIKVRALDTRGQQSDALILELMVT